MNYKIKFANTIEKLEKLFGLKVSPGENVLVSDINKPIPKFVKVSDIEFSLISPTGIELLVIRLHDGKVGSMRCGDKIMNLPLD